MSHFMYKDKAVSSIDELIEILADDGVYVEKNDWETVTSVKHELYDFETFIRKAAEYSKKKPADVVQFCEKAWGAAALSVKRFYLKNFGILIKSHRAESVMLFAICTGCNSKDAAFLGRTWKEAEIAHSNFYNMEFVTKPSRDSLLESITQLDEIINNKCDVALVAEELKKLDSITLHPVQEGIFKIGNDSFLYTRVAF
ncbi:hypothetical protein FO519_003044 [Halicephalobus sp. NKZ332]|nr:hypothetical protein FO519_003044 [Halicephalobus sp. NKZ332]